MQQPRRRRCSNHSGDTVRIVAAEVLHLQLPLTATFAHARYARSVSDTLLVRLRDAQGREGFGEILPRSYVTGETVESIIADSDATSVLPRLTTLLFETEFKTADDVCQWAGTLLQQHPTDQAAVGGLELAVWGLFAQHADPQTQAWLGPLRQRDTGNCVTIGLDAETSELRARAIHARLQRASVVKLKVGADDDFVRDVERLQELVKHLPSDIAVRVDANGEYSVHGLTNFLQLLQTVEAVSIESIEQPLAPGTVDLELVQSRLFERYQVPFIADESACSLVQVQQVIESGAWQGVNVRVGKHGGLLAAARIRDCVLAAGLQVVGGAMVGESSVMAAASALLLQHSEALDYCEGLEQNRRFLALDPVDILATLTGGFQHFRFKHEECLPMIVTKRRIESRVSP